MWHLLLLMLGIYSYYDIRRKSLPVLWLIMGMCVVFIAAAMCQVKYGAERWDKSLLQMAAGMLPGILLTIFSVLLKGKMGCGDGIVLAVIGGLTGMKNAAAILMTAMLLAFIYSCFLLVVCKKGKDYCFPFVPFYFVGTVMVYVLRVC